MGDEPILDLRHYSDFFKNINNKHFHILTSAGIHCSEE